MSTTKKALKLLLLLFLIFAIASLSSNTVNLVRRGLVVRKEQQELEDLKKENQRLRARLDYVGSEEFLEREARDSLGLTKEESILILPEEFFAEEKIKVETDQQPSVWRQWWSLFFK